MALINQQTLFDRLQKYIDQKTAELPYEIKKILDDSGIGDIVPHIDEITLVGDNIHEIVTVGNNMPYVLYVGNDIQAVINCSNNIDDIRNYGDTYYGPLDIQPATRPDGSPIQTGDMYFDTSKNAMMVYSVTATWIEAGSPFDAVDNSIEETAAAGQDTFNVVYDIGNVEVYIDGVRIPYNEYTATDGNTVVLDSPLNGGEIVFIQSFGTFKSADFFTKSQQISYFATKNGLPFNGSGNPSSFYVGMPWHQYHAVNILKLERDYLPNYSKTGHNHDEIYYRESEFIDAVDPVIGDGNKPVKTSSLTGKIDSTLLDIGGFTLQGPHTPTDATDEYPDTTNKDFGAFWVIEGLGDGVEYTYSSGSLAGKIVKDNNLIIYGEEAWVISATELSPESYVKRDGSNTMIGDLSFSNTHAPIHLANQTDTTPDDAAAQLGYVRSKLQTFIPTTGTTSPLTGYIEMDSSLTSYDLNHLITRNYVENNFATIDHRHNDLNDITDTSGTSLEVLLNDKANFTDLEAHTQDMSNPHSVTANQVGAPSGSWTYDPINNILSIENVPEV